MKWAGNCRYLGTPGSQCRSHQFSRASRNSSPIAVWFKAGAAGDLSPAAQHVLPTESSSGHSKLSKHYIIDRRSPSIPTTTAPVIAPAQIFISRSGGGALVATSTIAATCQPLRSPVWGYSSAKERAQRCAVMASFIPIISEILPMIMPASTHITTREELEPVHATVDGPVIERPAVVGRCDKMCASGT